MNQTPNAICKTNSPFQRPLTLIVAVFFLLTALAPLWLLFSATPVEEMTDPTAVTTVTTEELDDNSVEYMTMNDKIEAIASAIEKSCYTDETSATKDFVLTCTKILIILTVVSSLAFAVGLALMYFSVKIPDLYNSLLSMVCVSVVVIAVLLLTVMYASSITSITDRLAEIPNDLTLVDEKAKDTAKTEHLYFLCRNIAIITGLAFLVIRLPFFAVRCILSGNSKLKVLKSAKGLSTAYTAAALVCCFYITTICLTWEFNFITKALLLMTIMFAILCFMMIALLSNFRQHLKDCIIEEQNTKQPS